MLEIRLQVPEKRDSAGFVAIVDGFTTLIEDRAVATSGAGSGARPAAPGHPPFGRYELTARAPTPGGAETEYGKEILLFEPVAGPALAAESYGRFYVLLYAGSAGRDSFLRRTQGGVRLAPRAMDVLLAHIRDATEIELTIEALTSPPWWAFWRRRRTPPSLSADPARLTAPPHDEATIAAQMLRSAIRRERSARRSEERDDDRWRDRDSSSSGTSRESGTADFRGGGGTGGGGGASGRWSDAPAAGRGPGVSAAGVIAGAAGVAAIAAAAAGRETESGAGNDAEPSGMSESGTSESGTSGSATSESSGSGDADSGSTGTTTSTAY